MTGERNFKICISCSDHLVPNIAGTTSTNVASVYYCHIIITLQSVLCKFSGNRVQGVIIL